MSINFCKLCSDIKMINEWEKNFYQTCIPRLMVEFKCSFFHSFFFSGSSIIDYPWKNPRESKRKEGKPITVWEWEREKYRIVGVQGGGIETQECTTAAPMFYGFAFETLATVSNER